MGIASINSSEVNGKPVPAGSLTRDQIPSVVAEVLSSTPFIDIHTHLFASEFGRLGLWGIDELLTYHYLEAEFFRHSDTTPDRYWALSKRERADAIWRALFVESSPISEATRGIVAVLSALNLPAEASDLREARAFFEAQTIKPHIRRIFHMAGVSAVVMTNDPLDPDESPIWMNGGITDREFHAVVRLDRILWGWQRHWRTLAAHGYDVDEHASGKSLSEIRRFLSDCCERMHPVYMAVSLEDTFRFPDDSVMNKILSEAVLPSCREFELPMSLMIGVRRQVNPAIRLAGDGVGRADLRAVEYLCRTFSGNRFLVSVLSRENQHELCVYARKFSNLLPFGCWWFMNNGSIVEEITRERIEMLGTSFIPQHSDARVLEQLIYKWQNTRMVIGKVLADSYGALESDGGNITRSQIQRDVNRLFRSNFEQWTRTRSRED
jgi:hypothetical protein